MTIIIYTNKLIYVVSKLTIVTQQKFSPAYYVLPLGFSAVINFVTVFQLFGVQCSDYGYAMVVIFVSILALVHLP